MRRLSLAALLLCLACGGSTSIAGDGCNSVTPQGTFAFHATRLAVDPFGDTTCGALPTAFNVSLVVTANSATGLEGGVPFTASPFTSCQLVWNDPAGLEHIYIVQNSGRGSLTIAQLGRCAAIYRLTP